MRVSSACVSMQNGQRCSCAVHIARYSRSAAVQYDCPRIASAVSSNSGRVRKPGRYSRIFTMSGLSTRDMVDVSVRNSLVRRVWPWSRMDSLIEAPVCRVRADGGRGIAGLRDCRRVRAPAGTRLPPRRCGRGGAGGRLGRRAAGGSGRCPSIRSISASPSSGPVAMATATAWFSATTGDGVDRKQFGVEGGDARPVRQVDPFGLGVQCGDRGLQLVRPRPARGARPGPGGRRASAISTRSQRERSWSASRTMSPAGL